MGEHTPQSEARCGCGLPDPCGVSVSVIDGRIHRGTTPSPADLLGRSKERRSLEDLLDAVRGGQSRVLVVRGDAGIGKSALLQHLINAASGVTLAHATGVESEMELPFAGLHQLCASMLDRLDILPEPQRNAAGIAFGITPGTAPDRLLIGLAILHLLSAVSDDGPLLCVVDDVHWLDRASAEALAFVARRLQADPVGLVFATRHSTPDLVGFPELHLEGLKDGDAQALLGTVIHVPLDERVRDRIVAETRGNPLALMEWPRRMAPAELAGGFGMPAKLSMTGQIEEGFRRQLAELPSSTQRFLTVAAAEPTGDPVIVWRAASELGVTSGDAAPAIDAGLVDISVRVWFRHPLVRSAAYNAAVVTERQAAHRALAAATDADLDADRRAWHRALGAPGPDEDIAEALEQSASRARARGGVAAAGALLERSVALTVDPARRAQRILGAAAAHLDGGSFECAASLLALAETILLDQMGLAQADLIRASHAMSHGDVRDAPVLFLRAAQRLEPVAAELASTLYLYAVLAALFVAGLAGEVGLREAALAASTVSLPEKPTTDEWLLDGLVRFTLEGPPAAAPSLQRALEMNLDQAFGVEDIHGLGNLASAASALWDGAALHRLAILHVDATRESGALNMLPTALNTLAIVRLFEGDLDGAATAIAEAVQIVEATGSNRVPSAPATHAALLGDEGAEHAIDEQIAIARVARHGYALLIAYWARATLYNGRAEYEKALAAATEAFRHPGKQGSQLWFHELVEAAARCNQVAVAQDALEQLEETAVASDSDWALGILARSRALLAGDSTAEAGYREAIDRLTRTAIRPELARAHLLYGEWLRREHRRSDARAELRTAHETFTELGMHAFEERARRELLAAGETVRKRTAGAFDELTPQESHIARLAADGKTNPEIGAQLFISPRTVEWHLRKVFTKLDVTARRELRDALPKA